MSTISTDTKFGHEKLGVAELAVAGTGGVAELTPILGSVPPLPIFVCPNFVPTDGYFTVLFTSNRECRN